MSKAAKPKSTSRRFSDYLTPKYLLACNDVIISLDQSISFIRLIDTLTALILPLQPARLVLVAEFQRRANISYEEFVRAGLLHKFVLISPSGERSDLGTFDILPEAVFPLATTRTVTDLSARLLLKEEGVYSVQLLGRTHENDFEELLAWQLPVALSVGVPGLYLVEFNSTAPQVSETTHGIGHALLLPDQTIQGGDGGYVYNGRYQLDGTAIKVRLTVTRTNPYVPSIFGNIDRFELDVAGVIEGGVATLEGVRPDRPDDKVRIRLTRQTVTPDF